MKRFLPALTLAVLVAVSRGQSAPEPCWDHSLGGLQAAVERDPENAGLRVRLAQALFRPSKETTHPDAAATRVKEAHAHFTKTLLINPRAVMPLRVLSLDAYLTHRFEDTVTYGRRLLEVAPLDGDVSRNVVKALVRLKREDEAADILVEQAVTETASAFGLYQGLVSTLILNEKFQKRFIEKLDQALAAEPDKVFLRLVKCMVLAEIGRIEAAWAEAHAAEERGLCDTRTGARHPFLAALKSRAKEVGQEPVNYDGLDLEGVASRLAGQPGHVGLQMRSARLLDLSGRKSEALAGYEKVRKLNPAHWPAWYRAGEILLDDTKPPRPADAAALLSSARQLYPAFVPGLVREAEAFAAAANFEKCIAVFVKSADLYEPSEPTERVFRVLATGGEGAPIFKLIEQLKAGTGPGKPGSPFVAAHLALAYRAVGKSELARAAAHEAERLGLAGRDGYPSAILFDVYDLPKPKLENGSNSAGH